MASAATRGDPAENAERQAAVTEAAVTRLEVHGYHENKGAYSMADYVAYIGAMKAEAGAAVMPAAPAAAVVAPLETRQPNDEKAPEAAEAPAKAPETAEAPAKASAAAVVAPPEMRQPNDAASDAHDFDPDDDEWAPTPEYLGALSVPPAGAHIPQSIGWRGSVSDNLE